MIACAMVDWTISCCSCVQTKMKCRRWSTMEAWRRKFDIWYVKSLLQQFSHTFVHRAKLFRNESDGYERIHVNMFGLIFFQVWPYLLGYYKYGSELKERENEDNVRAHEYSKLLEEWTNVETLLRERTRVSETDRDSTADSADGKEDAFNETPENDTHDTKNDPGSPDSGSLSNGKLANGYGDNDAPGENVPNGTGESSPKSELDNESGCYDCTEECGNVSNAAYENGPSCEKCTLCNNLASASGDDVSLTNGYHGDEGETEQCNCKKEASSTRLSSYSVSCFDS